MNLNNFFILFLILIIHIFISCSQNRLKVYKSVENKDNFYPTNASSDYCNIKVGDCVSVTSCKNYLKKCNEPNNPYYKFNQNKLLNLEKKNNNSLKTKNLTTIQTQDSTNLTTIQTQDSSIINNNCHINYFGESIRKNTLESLRDFKNKCNDPNNFLYQSVSKRINLKIKLLSNNNKNTTLNKQIPSENILSKNVTEINVIDKKNKPIIDNNLVLINECIIIPTSTLGIVSETRKQILQNTLEGELKNYFKIISQERFEEVQEKVFEELEYEECTEDQCIVMIQDILQVENVFHLQIIGEEGDTQLSLSWRNLDEKKRENEFCEGCKTKQLNKKIKQMIDRFVKQI